MSDALIIGYGVQFDESGRVLLLHRRADHPPWADHWWLPGGATPLTEEPDATVPRLFAQLLRQRVAAAFIETVFGEEPGTGRHVVHNAYRVSLLGALDPQPPDETNDFDAAEWYEPPQALALLPPEQAALLNKTLEYEAAGVIPDAPGDVEALFASAPELPPAPAAFARRPREERRALGAALLAELLGDPNTAAGLSARFGAFGDWLVEHVWGEVWQTNALSRRDLSIAALALCACLRLHDALRFNLQIAEANGLPREQIAEICLQLAADAGFPCANETLGLLGEHWGMETDRFAPSASAAPPLDAPIRSGFALDLTSRAWAEQEVHTRTQLGPRERALISLTAALALGAAAPIEPLIRQALAQGLTAQELDGLLPLVAVFAGIHRAEVGAAAIRGLLE